MTEDITALRRDMQATHAYLDEQGVPPADTLLERVKQVTTGDHLVWQAIDELHKLIDSLEELKLGEEREDE